MLRFVLVVFTSIVCSVATAQTDARFPQPIGFINDFESDFSPSQLKILNDAVREMLMMAVERAYPKDMEMAIVTVNDSMLANGDIRAYAGDLMRAWSVGEKEPHNGCLVVINKKRVEAVVITGTGLQRILNEDWCNKLVNDTMIPEFRKNQYFDGVLEAIKTLTNTLGLNRSK